jgi:hypothetical protein
MAAARKTILGKITSYVGRMNRCTGSDNCAVLVKKYTEDHEWIELDSDGKTGTAV